MPPGRLPETAAEGREEGRTAIEGELRQLDPRPLPARLEPRQLPLVERPPPAPEGDQLVLPLARDLVRRRRIQTVDHQQLGVAPYPLAQRLAQLQSLLDRHLLGLGDHHDAALLGVGDERRQLRGHDGEGAAGDHLGNEPRCGKEAHAVARGRRVEDDHVQVRSPRRSQPSQQAQGVPQDRQLFQARGTGREVVVDGAVEHPPRQQLQLQTLAHHLVQHLAGLEVLHPEPRLGLDDDAARR